MLWYMSDRGYKMVVFLRTSSLILAAFLGLGIVVDVCFAACHPACISGLCYRYGSGVGCDDECNVKFGIDVSKSPRTCSPCAPGCLTSCNVNGVGKCEGKCDVGWTVGDKTCNDVDECTLNTDGCAQICTNTPGSFTCSCNPGYTLNADKKGCTTCDPNCASTCTAPYTCIQGGCKDPGYASQLWTNGLYICAPCDPYCAGSCNNRGPWKCDKICKTLYGLTHIYRCNRCSPNCITKCSVEGGGYCDDTPPNPIPCAFGYALANATNIVPGTVPMRHACYACATKCTSGCSKEGRGCCDPVAGTTTGTCSAGKWTVYKSSPMCHYCY